MNARSGKTLVGIDGCPGGWVAAAMAEPESGIRLITAAHLTELFEAFDDVAAVAIDMPIGLPESGRRRCDEEARQLLGERRSTLFFAPPRCVLEAKTHAEAGDRAFDVTGKRISVQAWNLVAKIKEVAELLGANERLEACTVETHPELCFARMAEGLPVAEPKKTKPGQAARVALLQRRFGKPTVTAALAAGSDGPLTSPRVDQLDALACLATAQHVARGTARQAPIKKSPGEPAILF